MFMVCWTHSFETTSWNQSGLKNLKETYLEYDELRTELSDNLKKLDKYLDKVIDMQCKIPRIDSLNYM